MRRVFDNTILEKLDARDRQVGHIFEFLSEPLDFRQWVALDLRINARKNGHVSTQLPSFRKGFVYSQYVSANGIDAPVRACWLQPCRDSQRMVVCNRRSTRLEELCRRVVGHNRTYLCEPIIHSESIRLQILAEAVKSPLLRRKMLKKFLRHSGLSKQWPIRPTRVSVRSLEQQRQVRILTRAEARIQLFGFRPEIQAQARDIQEAPAHTTAAAPRFSHEGNQIVERMHLVIYVGAGQHGGTVHHVRVAVDEPGEQCLTLNVDLLGIRSCCLYHVHQRADTHDLVAANRHRLCIRMIRFSGEDLPVVKYAPLLRMCSRQRDQSDDCQTWHPGESPSSHSQPLNSCPPMPRVNFPSYLLLSDLKMIIRTSGCERRIERCIGLRALS